MALSMASCRSVVLERTLGDLTTAMVAARLQGAIETAQDSFGDT